MLASTEQFLAPPIHSAVGLHHASQGPGRGAAFRDKQNKQISPKKQNKTAQVMNFHTQCTKPCLSVMWECFRSYWMDHYQILEAN